MEGGGGGEGGGLVGKNLESPNILLLCQAFRNTSSLKVLVFKTYAI